jgi:hypothetical protein
MTNLQNVSSNLMTQQLDKSCVLCEAPLTRENRSKEHVIPQWLLDFLQVREEKIQPTHFSITGEELATRQHTLEGLLARQICVV